MADGVILTEDQARLVLELARKLQGGGQVIPEQLKGSRRPIAEPLFLHNDSGEEIPAYACVQITGTQEIGPKNYLIAEKPADTDGTAGGFLFNGPRSIATGAEGIAQDHPVVRGYKNTGTVTGGEKWRPTSGQWYLTQDDDGQFIACGDDDVSSDVFRLVNSNAPGTGGSAGPFHVFELTSDVTNGTPSTATADILDADDESTEIEADVTIHLNLEMFEDLETGSKGTAYKYDGQWYGVNAPCDNELPQWRNGSGAPSSGLGSVLDYYLDDDTGDTYKKTGTSTWTQQGNIKGPQGDTGAAGADGADGTDGTVWFNTSGTPSSGTGVADDWAFDPSTGNVYRAS